MIGGVDEAGKGPVIGPMCVAGLVIKRSGRKELSNIGVKDSKRLTRKSREVLAEKIKDIAEKYFILEVSPSRIDKSRNEMTMNELMVVCYTEVLEKLRPDQAFVDASDVIAHRFGKNIMEKYSGDIIIISEHKADEKYPVVSAASILAKVQRDFLIRQLEEEVGMNIGSGYPADSATMRFLEDWVRDNHALPDFARESWQTSKRILEKYV